MSEIKMSREIKFKINGFIIPKIDFHKAKSPEEIVRRKKLRAAIVGEPGMGAAYTGLMIT